MKTILVWVNLLVPINLDESMEKLSDEELMFVIEENSCPGTWIIWREINQKIIQSEKTWSCWACWFQGKSTIINYNYDAD